MAAASSIRNKNAVSFGEATVVATVEALEDIDHSLWYQDAELKAKQKQELRLAQGILDDDEDDDSIACWRGFEPYQEGLGRHRRRRYSFVRALLNVQEELREMNISDPKGIQAFASAHSHLDCRHARKKGMEDEAYLRSSAPQQQQQQQKGKVPVKTVSHSKDSAIKRFLPKVDVVVSARSA